MSITILSKPYDGLGTLPKLNPVYNGLGFGVTSNMKQVPNFKYIAEIFINGGKIGQLTHNPDISNNNMGIFDIGRIVENFISYNLNWDIKTPTVAPNSLVGYHVEFGEEYSRIVNIKSVTSYGGLAPWAGKIRVETTQPHNLKDYDRVLVQASLISSYNGFKQVKYNSPTSFVIDEPFTSNAIGSNMYVVSGEKINQFMSYVGADGQNYVRLKVKGNTSFSIGNTININLDAGTSWITNYQNMDWTVVKTTITTTYSYVDTNIPFQSTISSAYTGSVISRGNFFNKNLMSTKNDYAMAFNGVEQYDTWMDWTPSPYLMTTSSGKFLTKRPRKEIDVCYSDYFTLSEFGKTNWTGATVPSTTSYIVETWSDLKDKNTKSVIGIGTLGLSMFVKIANNMLIDWTAGSYLNITGWYLSGSTYIPIHTSCRINYNGLSGSDTVLYIIDDNGTQPKWYDDNGTLIFTGYNAAMVIDGSRLWSVVSTKKVVFNKFTPPNDRNEANAGPKNLNLYEINNKQCYKYFVYHIKATTNSWPLYEKRSETFTFNIDCTCSKFKKHTLMWLNDLGGWDFYYFDLKSDIVREIERAQFHRHLKSYQQTGGYKYQQGDRGRTTYNTTSIDSTTVRTGYLTQDELNWMSNLLESPEVYWINNTTNSLGQAVDKIIPVNITDSKFDLWNKNNRNGDTGTLYIYELTFKSALNRGVQRGGTTRLPYGSTTVVNPGTTPNGPWSPWVGWRTSRDFQEAQYIYTKSLYE